MDIKLEKQQFEKQLEQMLIAFSSANSQIHYCQGMNFVCGFLLNVYLSSDAALPIFERIVETYELSGLYKEGVPSLHVLFFLLERIQSRVLPVLNKHLRV